MKHTVIQKTSVASIFFLLLIVVLPFLLTEKAEAASLQQAWIRFDRMATGTATTGTVCAKTAVAVATESNVVVTFPTGFTLGVFGTFTVDIANLPNGATGWLGILTATNVTGQAVTFPSSDLTADTLYCFNWTSTTAVQTGSAGANQTGTIASGGNSSAFSTDILTAGSDLINVTATVPPTFTFALGTNAAALGTLSPATTSATGVTATIATNAAAGWVAWVKSANAGLLSGSTTATVPTGDSATDNTPLDLAATAGYVLDVNYTDSAVGTGSISQALNYGQEYAGGTNADAVTGTAGGNLSITFQPIAASNGTTDNDVLTLIVRAKISAIQAAATDYADTLTVVAAGRF